MSKEQFIILQKKYKRLYIIGLILVAVFFFYFWQTYYRHWLIPVILFIITVGLFSDANESRKKYKELADVWIYEQVMTKNFSDVSVYYNPYGFEDARIVEEIREAELKYLNPQYMVELVAATNGYHKDLLFSMCEYRLIQLKQKKRDSIVERKVKYQGCFLKVYLPEPFSGEMQVHAIDECNYKRRLEKVEFEDIEFNKTFKVYASSQKDAFRLMKAKTMLLFVDIYNRKFASDFAINMDLCFLNGTFCTCKKRDNTLITVPFFKAPNIEKAQKQIEDIVKWIKDTITDFHLDSERYTTGS